MAKYINRQLGITGDIDFINLNRQRKRLTFPVTRPGVRTTVRVDTESGVAEMEHERMGTWDAMVGSGAVAFGVVIAALVA
jgi:hypothetical protein